MKKPTRKNLYLVVKGSSVTGSLQPTWLYYHGSPNWYPASDRRVMGMIKPNMIERYSLKLIKELGIPFPADENGLAVSICFRCKPDTADLILCSKKERKGW
jgi:hypothetical protein